MGERSRRGGCTLFWGGGRGRRSASDLLEVSRRASSGALMGEEERDRINLMGNVRREVT